MQLWKMLQLLSTFKGQIDSATHSTIAQPRRYSASILSTADVEPCHVPTFSISPESPLFLASEVVDINRRQDSSTCRRGESRELFCKDAGK